MQESPGWAPSGMACPWVDVLGRGWGKETASHSGPLRVPDPDTALTCPKGRVSCNLSWWGGHWGSWKCGPHLSAPC